MIVLALLVAGLPPLFGLWFSPAELGYESWSTLARSWFVRGLVLLVIACPCALVLSTPITIVSGLYRASRLGALVKGGAFIEQLGQVRCIALDKTGTLTAGTPRVVAVEPLEQLSRERILQVAAALESHSEHPLARSVVEAFAGSQLRCERFVALRGFGVSGDVEGQRYTLASPRYYLEQGLLPDSVLDPLARQRPDASLALLTIAGSQPETPRLLGAIYLRDEPRSDAALALDQLRRLGVERFVMLTGDHRPAAEQIARQVGLDAAHAEVHADLLPDDKIAQVRRLTAHNPLLAMVGDGVNDAPALAAAPIGIALGAGASDLALETADIAVLSPHLERVADLMRLSIWVRRVLIQNISIALAIKLSVLALAILGLAAMWAAVISDVGGSLLVIANGSRILHGKLPAVPQD